MAFKMLKKKTTENSCEEKGNLKFHGPCNLHLILFLGQSQCYWGSVLCQELRSASPCKRGSKSHDPSPSGEKGNPLRLQHFFWPWWRGRGSLPNFDEFCRSLSNCPNQVLVLFGQCLGEGKAGSPLWGPPCCNVFRLSSVLAGMTFAKTDISLDVDAELLREEPPQCKIWERIVKLLEESIIKDHKVENWRSQSQSCYWFVLLYWRLSAFRNWYNVDRE